MKRVCIIAWMLALAVNLLASEPVGEKTVNKHWTANPHLYANNMVMVGMVTLNDTEIRSESYEIGAFCGEECRGSELLAYYEAPDRYLVFLTVYGDDNDVISFRLYNHDNDYEYVEAEAATLTFAVNAIHGTPFNPYVFDITCPLHTVTCQPNATVAGAVSGGGAFYYGNPCTVTATANTGFLFHRWTENGVEVSAQPTYSFNVTASRDLVAEFIWPATDTVADACDAFTWYGHTYNTSGVYHDTLTSSIGIDSVMALHLTLHPPYSGNFSETACGVYYWDDEPFEESGEYTKTYPSMYGCDSTMTLHLTIIPIRPLGNFGYMSPANNYVVRFTNMDFYWSAVSNADAYDFYLWQGDDGRPETPTLANTTSFTYRLNNITHGSVYHWCVVAKNECDEEESEVRTFTCQLDPAMTVVPRGTIDFGEVELGQSSTRAISVSGTALTENISYTFLDNAWGQDAPFFQITPSNWEVTGGGMLHVTFTPEPTQLYYNTAMRIVSGAFADTVYFVGSVANRYVFTTEVEGEVYAANDNIEIHGHVEDILGDVVPDLAVTVYLTVMGSRITMPVVSDANGDYTVTYVPRYSESGYYQVGSCLQGDYTTAVHDAFDIPGISRVDSDFIIWTPYQDETVEGEIEIRNRSRIPVSGIQVNTLSLPSGCTVELSGVTELGPLETGLLHYTVTGSEVSTGNSFEEALFEVTSEEGVSMNLTCYYYCRPRRGALEVYPPSVATTMQRNSQKVFSFQIANNGNGETGPITIGLPNVSWMSVMGESTLPSLQVGDSCMFSIMLFPDANMGLSQYSGSFAVNCANGNGVAIPYQLTVTADTTTTVIIDVTDDYTYNTNNGNGPHLAGANVSLTGYYTLETVAEGMTDENGLFTVEDVPEGYYYLSIYAESHKSYDGIIYVDASQSTRESRQEVYLQFQAITYSWVVVPTEIEDEYTFELVAEIKTNVPVPVVVIEGPGFFDALDYGDTLQYAVTVSNRGLVDAYDTHITIEENYEEYVFIPMFDVIDTIHAHEVVVVPCIMTRVEGDRESKLTGNSCDVGFAKSLAWYRCNQDLKCVEHQTQFTIDGSFNCSDYASYHPASQAYPYYNAYSYSSGSSGSGAGLPPIPNGGALGYSAQSQQNASPEVATTSQDCVPCWQSTLPMRGAMGNLLFDSNLQELIRQSRSCTSTSEDESCSETSDSVTEWPLWSQTGDLSKIDPELQELMHQSRDGNERFRVIIEMKEQYDNPNLERGTAFMTRAERRDFVVDELKRFSESSQSEITRYLDAKATRGGVNVLHHFWIFNGIYCEATAECIDELSTRSDVKYVSLDKEMEMKEPEQPIITRDGPLQGAQWHVAKVQADRVWNEKDIKGRGVVVAIIDSGVNYNHPDIADNMWDGGASFPNHGWNFNANNNDPMDYDGHGSHVAGIVASNGSVHKAGVAPGAKIMALKGLDRLDAVVSSIEFAVGHGADIINISAGNPGVGGNADIRRAFVNALNAGVVATVSAGNYGNDDYPVPQNVTDVGSCPPPWHNEDQMEGGASAAICVGNTDENDEKAASSSVGPVTWQSVEGYGDYPYDPNNPNSGLIRPDVSAPGENIWSLNCKYTNSEGDINNDEPKYVLMNGTSMASPCVAGVIALMLEANPNLTPANIDEILETTAVRCKGQTLHDDGRIVKDNNCGSGRVNALRAVDSALVFSTVDMCRLTVTTEPFGCFDVTVTSEPYEEYIDVKNGVLLPKGTPCTVKASNTNPFTGTQPFLYWKKNSSVCYDGVTFYDDYVTLDITLDEDMDIVAVYTNVCKHIGATSNGMCSTITGGGNYLVGQTCTLVAEPENQFLYWEQNGVRLPDQSPRNQYSFDVVETTGDEQFNAVFNECCQVELYKKEGSDIFTFDTYNSFKGETCQFSVKIPEGYGIYSYYRYHSFLGDLSIYYLTMLLDQNGQRITDPHYSFTVMGADTLVVEFKKSFLITAETIPPMAGTVEGTGNYFLGEQCALTAIPNQGYRFVGWFKGSMNSSNSFIVNNNNNYVAIFAPVAQNNTSSSSILQGMSSDAGLLQSYSDAIDHCMLGNNRDSNETENLLAQLEQCQQFYQSILNLYTNLFQEEEWMEEQNIAQFLDNFYALVDPIDQLVSPQATQQLIDLSELTSANASVVQSFVDRWNRSVQYWNQGIYTLADLPEGYDPSFVQMDSTMLQSAVAACDYATAHGFNNFADLYYTTLSDCNDLTIEHQTDVCAKISVSFKQRMTMTREAFEGTLKIANGHATDPMQDIDVDIVIRDMDGVDRTDLFQVNVKSLSEITGVDGTGSLDAQTEGTVMFEMIPTIEAAPDTSMYYSFGGSFSFLDPFSGEVLTYPLYPVKLQVNPSPDLHVDYFISRHLISDDPLTDDTIEATQAAELAMMIRNVGAGDANNVFLQSSQPEVIDNQSGLLIQFDIVGSAMNGEERPLGLTDIPFGTIASHTAGIAEWYFTSSLLARVIHSTPHVIHNNSYGNPKLSLVTELHSHDLIHAVRAYGDLEDGINDFLVNEMTDFNHTPDMIYFSHGGTSPVSKVINASTEGSPFVPNSEVTLTMTPTSVGWNYACVDDPSEGQLEIIACLRDDGQEIPLSNVWTTWTTMFDDDAPIHENKLHIVDTLATTQPVTYQLVFGNDLYCKITITVNPANCGQATGAGYYLRGDTVTLKAVPSFGYEFDSWTEGNNVISNDTVLCFIAGVNRFFRANFYLSTNTSQQIHLDEGWNWFSSYITYDENTLPYMEQQVGGNNAEMALIKSQSAFTTLDNHNWSGTLNSLVNHDMYMILVDHDVDFTLTGTIVRPSIYPITLMPGWTWVCYISNREMTLEQSLASLSPSDGDLIKGQNGFSAYDKTSGSWFGNLPALTPGKGYAYLNNSDDNQTLVYPNSGMRVMEEETEALHWSHDWRRFMTNMTMMVSLDPAEFLLGRGSHEIAAFVGDDCRGSARLQEVNGRYIAFLAVGGEDGEVVRFRLFDVASGEEYSSQALEVVGYVNDAVYGSLRAPYLLHFQSNGVEEETEGVSLFPNPTDSKVTVTGHAITGVKVYNALGQLVLEKACGHEDQVELNLGRLSAGVYTVSVYNDNGIVNKLLIRE